VQGIRDDATYIFTHPELAGIFEPRLQAIRDALSATKAHSGVAVDVDELK
jgi:hypothetical protein